MPRHFKVLPKSLMASLCTDFNARGMWRLKSDRERETLYWDVSNAFQYFSSVVLRLSERDEWREGLSREPRPAGLANWPGSRGEVLHHWHHWSINSSLTTVKVSSFQLLALPRMGLYFFHLSIKDLDAPRAQRGVRWFDCFILDRLVIRLRTGSGVSGGRVHGIERCLISISNWLYGSNINHNYFSEELALGPIHLSA